jgi:hypothetical protein
LNQRLPRGIERAKRGSSARLDLVSLAARNEDQRARHELVAAALDNGVTATGDNVKPLVGAAMAIARISLLISGRDDHLRGLRAAVAANHAECFFEPQTFEFRLR